MRSKPSGRRRQRRRRARPGRSDSPRNLAGRRSGNVPNRDKATARRRRATTRRKGVGRLLFWLGNPNHAETNKNAWETAVVAEAARDFWALDVRAGVEGWGDCCGVMRRVQSYMTCEFLPSSSVSTRGTTVVTPAKIDADAIPDRSRERAAAPPLRSAGCLPHLPRPSSSRPSSTTSVLHDTFEGVFPVVEPPCFICSITRRSLAWRCSHSSVCHPPKSAQAAFPYSDIRKPRTESPANAVAEPFESFTKTFERLRHRPLPFGGAVRKFY